jgi:hypothetical protein
VTGVEVDMVCESGQLSAEIADPLQSPEIHVIGLYEASGNHQIAGPFSVHIDRGTEVILVLSSYEQVDWTVTVENGTELLAVVVNGYEDHIVDAPNGVEIIDWAGQGQYVVATAFEWSDPDTTQLVSSAENATDGVFASFHGCYRAVQADVGQQ